MARWAVIAVCSALLWLLGLGVAIQVVSNIRSDSSANEAPVVEGSGFSEQPQSARLVGEPASIESEPVPVTTTTTGPRRTAQLAFTGDILAHQPVVRQARSNASGTDADYDFAPMFALVEPILSAADLAICHLETPLSPDNDDLSGFPTFSVPHEMADGLVAAGYDGCTFASNHSLDRRPEGVGETLDILDAAGLGHSGAARDQVEYGDVTIYDAGGIAVASLSYTYWFNGFRESPDTPWLVNEIEIGEITDEVDRAREAGAEYVVLSLHWGTENRNEPDDFQLEFAQEVAAIDGLDIVIGHHAHVVQPVDVVGDLPVVYGLGNFLSNQSANCCPAGTQDGVIMQVNIQEVPGDLGSEFVTWLTYAPTFVDRSDYTIVPVADVLENGQPESFLTQETLERSRERTATALRLPDSSLTAVEQVSPTDE